MPTVPFAPTVDYQVGGLQGFTAPTAEPMKDATGAQIAQRGAAYEKIGTTAMVMATRLELEAQRTQDVLDETDAAHALNGFSSFAGKNLYGDTGFMLTTGMQANPDALQATVMTLTEERDRVRASLPTAHAQKLFDLKSEGMMGTLGTEMTKHASVETKLAHTAEGIASAQSQLQLSLPGAREWGDANSTFNTLSTAGIEQFRQTLVRAGSSPKVVNEKVLDLTTKFNSAVIHQFLAQGTQQGAEQAQAYLVAHEKQIDWAAAPGLKDLVHKHLEVAEVAAQGFEAMDKAVKFGVPGHDAKDILKEELKSGHLTQKVYDNALARLEAEIGQQEKAVIRYEHTNLKDAFAWADDPKNKGKSFAQMPVNLVALIPAGQAHNVKTYIEQGNDPVTNEATLYHLKRMSGDDPVEFAKRDLMQFKGVLSKADLRVLDNMQVSINRGDLEQKEVSTLYQAILPLAKMALRETGVDVNPAEGTPAARKMNQFSSVLIDTLTQMQQDHTLPKSMSERKTLVNQLLRESIDQSGVGWFEKSRKVVDTLYRSEVIPHQFQEQVMTELSLDPNFHAWTQEQRDERGLRIYRAIILKGGK